MKFKIHSLRIKNTVAKKFISRTVIAGLLFSNISSVASVMSEDGRYESFEGDNIIIEDILEDDKVDVEIEGNTLVNLKHPIEGYSTKLISPLIVGEKYTFIYEFESNLDCLGRIEESTSWVGIANNIVVNNGKNRINICVKIPSDYTGQYHLVLTNRYNGEWSNEVEFTNVKGMVLKGDYTSYNLDIFEGIQSSFQNNLVTQEMIDNGEESQRNLGKYKVQINTGHGKNLFNKNNAQHVFIDGNSNPGTIQHTVSGKNRSSAWIKCKPNTYYTVSGGERNRWLLKNKNGEVTYIGSDVGFSEEHKTIRTLDDTVEFMCYVIVNDISYLDTIQIEEGQIATTYEPYQESTLNLYLKEPLRALPNGVKDKIIKKDGQWVVERNLKEVVLDGSSKYSFHFNYFQSPNPEISNFSIGVSNDDSKKAYQDGIILSNNIPQGIGHYVNRNTFNISAYIDKTALFVGTIPNHYLDTVDLEGIIKFFNDNPSNIIYELAQPVYESLNINPYINLYKGINYINNNSNISTNMKVTVDRKVNRAYEAIEAAKSNPTIDNISIARMWVNLLDDSSLKDELQDDIGEIVQVEDMQIERKTVSSNIDLYVRSENALSMSLSTNSVTFDNYSSVSDSEMLNAVEVTINSSLPYSFNTCLEAPIESLDGESIIQPNTLSIRENGTTYKVFTDVKEKIVLNDNTDAGNNNVHNIDLKLSKNTADKANVYKTTIKFEAVQK